MEDNQLIARTRHLAVANLLLGTPTSGSSASSVPASPRSVLVGSAARPTRGGSSDGSSGGDDDDNDDDAVVGDALDEDHEDGGGGQGGGAIGGLQRDRSTAVAGIMAAGARPLEGLVDQESEACDAAAVWCPSPSASASASACLSWPSPLSPAALSCRGGAPLEGLPVEVLFHIMGFLDVNDLLSVSRVWSFPPLPGPHPCIRFSLPSIPMRLGR